MEPGAEHMDPLRVSPDVTPLRRVRFLLVFYSLALLASGLTVFWLPWETRVLVSVIWGDSAPDAGPLPGMHAWLVQCRDAIAFTEKTYPFMFYGTDWLGFAHVILAILFLGAARDPERNIWVIHCGLIACALVVIHAVFFVPLRGLPWEWILVDSSFGVFGCLPLLWILRDLRRMRESPHP